MYYIVIIFLSISLDICFWYLKQCLDDTVLLLTDNIGFGLILN